MKTYRTNEIAAFVGVHPNTVMLYEQWGYLSPIRREENGYRIYTETHLAQVKMARMLLSLDRAKSYMRFEIQRILRASAQGDINEALAISQRFLAKLKNEIAIELKLLPAIKTLLEREKTEREMEIRSRKQAAITLEISFDVIVHWERNGLIHVPRDHQGHRQYGERELKQLQVIKLLRKENYSTQCIRKIMNRLMDMGEDMRSLQAESGSDEAIILLSSLGEMAQGVEGVIKAFQKAGGTETPEEERA